jgi:hypothetical protein
VQQRVQQSAQRVQRDSGKRPNTWYKNRENSRFWIFFCKIFSTRLLAASLFAAPFNATKQSRGERRNWHLKI